MSGAPSLLFFLSFFKLEHSCFTMLYQFLGTRQRWPGGGGCAGQALKKPLSDSAIGIHISSLFWISFHLGYHRALSRVPCTIQQVLISYLFHLLLFLLFSCQVVSESLQPSMLCCPWDFPGRDTGVSCRFFLQGLFLTWGLNLYLLHWQMDSFTLSHQGSHLFQP